jgi:hypothetical protein
MLGFEQERLGVCELYSDSGILSLYYVVVY